MIGEIIGSFAQAFTLLRRGPGSFTSGRYLPAAQVASAFTGAVAPATPEDLKRLPEGLRTEGALVFFTEAELRTAREPASPSGWDADQILYRGRLWEVQSVEDWAYGSFFRVIAVKHTQTSLIGTLYYGVAVVGATLASMTSNSVQTTREFSYTFTAGASQYIHVFYPATWGAGTFVGATMTLVGTVTVSSVVYNHYRSSVANLGTVTLVLT